MTLAQARAAICDGVATGGMIPKLETAIHAVEQGVEAVAILDGRRPHAMLVELFALTPAEARVASMIAAGSSPEEIAEELSLARETVRNQIKAIFAKTDTHRQNELAALIGRLDADVPMKPDRTTATNESAP